VGVELEDWAEIRGLHPTELVDLVEVDAASAERAGEGPAVALDSASSAPHAHAHDGDELASSVNRSPGSSASFAFKARAKALTRSRGRANVAMTAEVAAAMHRVQGRRLAVFSSTKGDRSGAPVGSWAASSSSSPRGSSG
jgi:hypothetical protein